MAKWTVLLFAGAADAIGSDRISLETADDAPTAGDIKRELIGRYPEAARVVSASFVACDYEYIQDHEPVKPGSELALIPPVSGGQPHQEDQPAQEPLFRLTREAIDLHAVSSLVSHPDHGANLVFAGSTREWTDGRRTVRLEYDAYEPMALREMEKIGNDIGRRWPGTRTAIVHRLGPVGPGEISVVIAVSSPRRAAAYEASRYAIDQLKLTVPIWKKEIWEDGSEWKGDQTGPWNPLAREKEDDSL